VISKPSNNFYDISGLVGYLESDQVILTPNQRLARRIRLGWGRWQVEQGRDCWNSPPVMSLQQWWQHCYEMAVVAGAQLPNLLTSAQELALWQTCIQQHPASAVLLRPRGAAQLARDAYQHIQQWQIDWRSEPMASTFKVDADASLFLEWLEEFEQQLQTRQLSTMQQLLPQLAAQHPCEVIVLAEFDELSPLYLQSLQAQAQTVENYSFRADSGSHRIVACEDSDGEVLAAAAWAQQIWSRDPEARVGLLVPQLQQRRQTVQRALQQAFSNVAGLQRKALPVNFSAGVSLDSCGVVRTALGLLKLATEDSNLPLLVQLLHSRYRDNTEFLQEQQLIQRLYRRGRERVAASLLRHECARIKVGAAEVGLQLGRQLLELSQQRELRERHLPSQWGAMFSACLERLGWPGNAALDSEEYQQIEHWHGALAQLAELDRVCKPLTFSAALGQLQQICREAVFQSQTEDAQIQVLGLLEAAGLQFDYLWLCGMGSNEWPPAATPTPFIPGQLQRQLNLPHANAERELQYAQGLMHQFIACGADIVASYSRFDADVAQPPSPLLNELAATEEIIESGGYAPAWLEIQAQNQGRFYSDETAPGVSDIEATDLRGGSGLIADQSQCPFRAFAYHRLGARPLPDLAVALTAAERGSILHDALYTLWGELANSSALKASSEEEREQLIVRACTAAVGEFRRHHPQPEIQALLDIEQRRLQTLLKAWLQLEAEREDFEVLAREEGSTIELGKLRLQLRIDRIDQLASGGKMIIDYKSGSGEIRYWGGERPQQPQLPLYAQALGDEVEAVSFAIVSSRECAFRGLGRHTDTPGIKNDIASAARTWEQAPQDWDTLQEYWQRSLARLAQDFLDGKALVDPVDKRNTCTWCGLESLCRIQ
jgi:ATP-dependent helicase/nuclease subunit B